jgi:hypothetical protein
MPKKPTRILDTTLVEEVRITSWSELMAEFERMGAKWCFRGQENADWVLATTLERSGSLFPSLDERDMLRRFQRRAKTMLSLVPDERETLSWLAIMQHYGAPTRLLDFTRSPYVALFFAFERPSPSGVSRALWAVNTLQCKDAAADRLGTKNPGVRFEFFEKLQNDQMGMVQTLFDSNDRALVIVAEPWNFDDRQDAQQTLFVMPGRSDSSFMGNLSGLKPCPRLVRKLTIPDNLRPAVLGQLTRMNVTARSLFPGLDGFARSMHSFLRIERP